MNSGFGYRHWTWFYLNYIGDEENGARELFMYIPILILALLLPALHVLLSFLFAVGHLLMLLFRLFLFLLVAPAIIPICYMRSDDTSLRDFFLHGILISFCNVVKYGTGLFCFYSQKLVSFRVERGDFLSSKWLEESPRALFNLHGLHASSHKINFGSPFQISIALPFVAGFTALLFCIIRALVFTAVSGILCIASWQYFAFQYCCFALALCNLSAVYLLAQYL